MKILVDADACPVKKEIVRVAKEYNLEVLMFIDTSHLLNDDYAVTITVDKGRDSADLALANRTSKGDIVVTQDYGVAAMALGKRAYAMNQNGFIYNDNNIDQLLFERELLSRQRRMGRFSGKIKKRTKSDNEKFEINFRRLINEVIGG